MSSTKKIVLIAGARPNFVKIAPIYRALKKTNASVFLVHTGQHYDDEMSGVFFRELGLGTPDVNLNIGSGDRIEQTKKIFDGLIPVLKKNQPDLVVTVGDVTSSAAATLASVVSGFSVAHVEAGLRSFNNAMPEEINRLLADHYADKLFVTEESGLQNLKYEGIKDEKTFFVGNVMIDTLRFVEASLDTEAVLSSLNLEKQTYVLLTLHRGENVDSKEIFTSLWETLVSLSEKLSIVFPVHPRTAAKMKEFGLKPSVQIRLLDPQSYSHMLALQKGARFVMTDSGGIQEETTALQVPCLTLRTETERPITVSVGTNEVVGLSREKIMEAFDRVLAGRWKKGSLPALWDGHAAERIAEILVA